MQAFAKQVSEYTKAGFDIDLSADAVDLTYSVALHNAIMLYAHAATKVLAAGGDLHDGRAVTEAVRNTTFVGVGHSIVDLDQHGDRIESYEVMNYVKGADGGIESVAVGVYNRTLQQYVAYEREVEWPGGQEEAPLAWVPYACPRGTHALNASLDCVPCPFPRMYQDLVGETNCKECPPNSARVHKALATDVSFCMCKPGFWARTNHTYLGEACPERGAVCEGSAVLPYAKPGFWAYEHDRCHVAPFMP